MLKWIKQGKEKNCGIIALAVITGKSLKTIIKLLGCNSYTKTKDLVKVLRKLGYECPDRLKSFKKNIPELAIAKLSFSHTRYHWHWVVIDKDKIYDGVHGNKKGKVKFPFHIE